MKNSRSAIFCLVAAAACFVTTADAASVDEKRLDAEVRRVEEKVIAWRRDIHQHPELSNREVRTAKLVAEHLRKLGLEVETGIAHTGVVALLRGARSGPTIALRADMDALPVTEKTDVPFKSRVTATYRGEKVGVMHACGHDMHTAVLMGAAEVLTRMRDSLAGNVLFIFQPAEEGAPEGEEGGASLMLKEGLFDRYKPQVTFGMHTRSLLRVGEIGLRPGPIMAASDAYRILVRGRQAHGSTPWQGVDPIVTAAHIITALQTVVSRSVDITANPAVVTVGAIKGGIRHNIIPDEVELIGTIRTFDKDQRAGILRRIETLVSNIAAANGATATFELATDGNPVVVNDPGLTAKVRPGLEAVVGAENVKTLDLITGAEDFAFYANAVPSVFFFVGITPADQDPRKAPSHHSDHFYVDEGSIPVALRAMVRIATDYLSQAGTT